MVEKKYRRTPDFCISSYVIDHGQFRFDDEKSWFGGVLEIFVNYHHKIPKIVFGTERYKNQDFLILSYVIDHGQLIFDEKKSWFGGVLEIFVNFQQKIPKIKVYTKRQKNQDCGISTNENHQEKFNFEERNHENCFW